MQLEYLYFHYNEWRGCNDAAIQYILGFNKKLEYKKNPLFGVIIIDDPGYNPDSQESKKYFEKTIEKRRKLNYMNLISNNNSFYFNSEGIEEDGQPICLNKGRNRQIGFITKDGSFYMDTEEDQISLESEELEELVEFVRTIKFQLS